MENSEGKKVSIAGNIRVRTYNILTRAIEDGITFGWNRAYKYTDNPTPDVFHREITNAIMMNIDESFIFPELEDE